MTAIGGVISIDGRPVGPECAAALREGLQVYGRDAWDEWRYGTGAGGGSARGASTPVTSGAAGSAQSSGVLVRALLRTLPEDAHDRQPMWHEPSGTAMVFDGRIDNRDEIARALDVPPADLAQMADSDLALRAALAWDMAAAERLRGAFAFACWQPARRRLWLARDGMGHRPLFWHRSSGMIAFASMPSGILALPGVSRALDELEVARILMLKMQSGAQSVHAAIQRAEAGRTIEFVDGDVRIRRFHALDARRELRLARDDDYVDAFREALDRAVARCLRSCGPVVSQLSSGYDSSTVTATAARLLAVRGERMLAYTAVPRPGFSGPVVKGREADESTAAAALVARLPSVDHIKISGAGLSVLECARKGARLMCRPLRNPTNTPWMFAITDDAVARGAKVVLTGQCGNATISLTGRQLPQVLFAQGRVIEWWHEAVATRRRSGRRGPRGWLGLVRGSAIPLLPDWFMRWHRRQQYGTSDTPPLWSSINPELYSHWRARGELEGLGLHGRSGTAEHARSETITMLERIELGEHAAMKNAAGIDLRDPTKDQDLAEFCISMPLEQLCRGGQTRWLLRRAMAGVLPPEIMDCKAKGIQAADWFEAIGAELPQFRAEAAALAQSAQVRHFIDVDGLQRTLNRWPTGGWDRADVNTEFHFRMPRGLTVGMFVHRAAHQ